MKKLIPKKHLEHIILSDREISMVKMFNFWDKLDANGKRKKITNKGSVYEPYYKIYEAKTFDEKLEVINYFKIEKTKQLIYYRQKLDYIPNKVWWSEMKTNCGRVRLVIANHHKLEEEQCQEN